jgi:drug/metabolite transporter (DMT)-like permease
VLNSVVPFSLYAFAALHLPASYSAIFYSSTSLFGAAFAALWLAEPMMARKSAGLLTGFGGVALVAGVGGIDMTANVLLAAWPASAQRLATRSWQSLSAGLRATSMHAQSPGRASSLAG